MKWQYKRQFIKLVVKWLEKSCPFFLSIKFREKQFSDSNLSSLCKFASGSETGILMQGPLILKNDFTCETLKLYRTIYPNVTIVFSTWELQDESAIKRISDQGIKVILNPYPDFKGTQNINLQLCSTSAGLKMLKESSNIKYVLKTRSDQRINKNVDFLLFFESLLIFFPIKRQTILKERLIITGLNTFLERLYGITDMLMFGGVDDMIRYWDIPLQKETKILLYKDPAFFIKNEIAEGYLVNQFFKSSNFDPNWTKSDHLKFLKRYFLVIEKEEIDLFWFKYERYFENLTYLDHENWRNKRSLSFVDWLNIAEE